MLRPPVTSRFKNLAHHFIVAKWDQFGNVIKNFLDSLITVDLPLGEAFAAKNAESAFNGERVSKTS